MILGDGATGLYPMAEQGTRGSSCGPGKRKQRGDIVREEISHSEPQFPPLVFTCPQGIYLPSASGTSAPTGLLTPRITRS